MKIDLPVVEHMVKVLVKSPSGECVKVLDGSHRSFEIDLPDSVLEDEVEVMACVLDACGHAQGEPFYLKEAVEVEPKEKDDEEAPVEADEDAPAEVADKKAPDYPEKEVEAKELPAPRELGDEEKPVKRFVIPRESSKAYKRKK